MKKKEKMLKEIESLACNESTTRRMYLACPLCETTKMKSLNDSLEYFKEKLTVKTNEFIEAFPEESKEKLEKFIESIQGFESLIFDENRKIEAFQKKKSELLNEFIEGEKMKFKDFISSLSEKITCITVHRLSDHVFQVLHFDKNESEYKKFVNYWIKYFSEDKVLKVEEETPHTLYIELV